MIYEYSCPKCGHRFDVVKPASQMTDPETCGKCGAPADRQFVPSRVHFTGTGVQHAEYNPAFGRVVRNKRHRDELAKRAGVIEVGNDFKSGENQQKHYDTQRAEKHKRGWEEL